MTTPSRLGAAALAALAAGPAAAQQQVVRPPIAQYWMDVATSTMAGMPEMAGLSGMPGMPAFLGGGTGNSQYGNARGMAMGRWLDLALHTRMKPSGTDGTHAIPPAMQMGASLPLVPVKAEPTQREPGQPGTSDGVPEHPTGRILIYWGCGDAVRAGQPRIIDLASAGPAEFGRAFGGRFVPDRGARVESGHSLWPNETNRTMVPRESSLVGDHTVSGEGVPASMRFAIGQMQDFMPAIFLTMRGPLTESVALQWQAMPAARGYDLHAFGRIDKDMIIWSSAETPDTGMGLVDYLPNATIDRWVREKVLLPATETRCAVPKGIFAGNGRNAGGMLRMIAYGHELNLAHPPRPADPRSPWEPEWAVRVRVKSTTMAALGQDTDAMMERQGRGRDRTPSAGTTPASDPAQQQAPAQADEQRSVIPGLPLPGGAGKAIDTLRGIFGR